MTLYCGECGKATEGKVVDLGIGPYEFWGQKGVHRALTFVSTCCEAEVLDEKGEVYTLDDYEDDQLADMFEEGIEPSEWEEGEEEE